MEISDLLYIGKLKNSQQSDKEKGKSFRITVFSDYESLLGNLKNVFLIYTDHSVRYVEIDILRIISENQADVSILDDDIKSELLKEKQVGIYLDEDELNAISDDEIYYDPIGMDVYWNDEAVAIIKSFFYNGAHYVYELEMNDKRIILIPDVEAFVIETNTTDRYIKVIDLDLFLNI